MSRTEPGSINRPTEGLSAMPDDFLNHFRVLGCSEFEVLSIEEKVAYLEVAVIAIDGGKGDKARALDLFNNARQERIAAGVSRNIDCAKVADFISKALLSK